MFSQKFAFVAAGAVVLGIAGLSQAASIIVNGGFETADSGPTDALGWSGENGTTITRLPTGGVGGTAGALISNTVLTSSAGPLTQNTGFAGGASATGGVDYTLSFDSQRTFAVGGVFFVQLVARDDLNNVLGFPVQPTLTSPTTGFEHSAYDFTAPAGTTRFEINFFAITGGGTGSSSNVVLDNVSIAPVPEPASAAVLGLCGLGLLRRRRRS